MRHLSSWFHSVVQYLHQLNELAIWEADKYFSKWRGESAFHAEKSLLRLCSSGCSATVIWIDNLLQMYMIYQFTTTTNQLFVAFVPHYCRETEETRTWPTKAQTSVWTNKLFQLSNQPRLTDRYSNVNNIFQLVPTDSSVKEQLEPVLIIRMLQPVPTYISVHITGASPVQQWCPIDSNTSLSQCKCKWSKSWSLQMSQPLSTHLSVYISGASPNYRKHFAYLEDQTKYV